MSTIYGLIHEPDARCAPRFRPRVNGRWIDIQLAEALLTHDIIEDWLRPAREAMAIGAKFESEHVAVRDLVTDKHRGKLEVDFDGGMPTVGPGRVVHRAGPPRQRGRSSSWRARPTSRPASSRMLPSQATR